MEETLVHQLVEFLNEASPVVWAAAQRQVLASVVCHVLWAVFVGVAIGVLFGAVRLSRKNILRIKAENDKWSNVEGWQCAFAFSAIGIVFLSFLFVFILSGILHLLISPDYTAIRYVINLIPGQ